MQKITPSEDIQLAWLAGIIDGEGSIGQYWASKQIGRFRFNVCITNTDEKILNTASEILKKYQIKSGKYSLKPQGKLSRKSCYQINIWRKEDVYKILSLVGPYLVGKKRRRAYEIIKWIDAHPSIVYRQVCENCGAEIWRYASTSSTTSEDRRLAKGIKKRRFCSLKCWYEYQRTHHANQ